MSNILVTGGAGYIGSHIVELLIKRRIKVIIVDNLSTGFKKLINNKAKFYKLDIFNKEKLKKIILRHNVKSVFHMAASVSVGLGEKFPKKYFKNNVGGTVSLLNACKSMGVKNFIFSSTAAVYKDGLSKVNEKSKKNPKSVYGKTKLKAENKIVKCCKKYKINYGILRYFNVVGASPSGKIGLINKNDHLFKNFSAESLKKKPVFSIYGKKYETPDKTAIRDYIHVSDLADIHIRVLEKILLLKKSIVLNCGYGKGISVLKVAKEFAKQAKKNIAIVIKNERPGDSKKIITDNKKLLKFIKWKPKYNKLSSMVKSSLGWERNIAN